VSFYRYKYSTVLVPPRGLFPYCTVFQLLGPKLGSFPTARCGGSGIDASVHLLLRESITPLERTEERYLLDNPNLTLTHTVATSSESAARVLATGTTQASQVPVLRYADINVLIIIYAAAAMWRRVSYDP
jgi:hypothetical protein